MIWLKIKLLIKLKKNPKDLPQNTSERVGSEIEIQKERHIMES